MNSLKKSRGLWRPLKLTVSLSTSTLLQKAGVFPSQTEVATEDQSRCKSKLVTFRLKEGGNNCGKSFRKWYTTVQKYG